MVRHARDAILMVRSDGTVLDANDAAEQLYLRTRDELIGLAVRELRAPAAREDYGDQLRQALDAGITFETVHLRADGVEFPVEVSSIGAEVDGERVAISVVRDVTRRKQREAEREALMGELTELNHRLDAMLHLVSSALGSGSPQQLMDELLCALRDVMGAETALFFVPEGEGMRLRALCGLQNLDTDPLAFKLEAGTGFAAHVAQRGDVLTVADVQQSDFALPVHATIGARTIVGVPLQAAGRLQGVLECLWLDEREIAEAEVVMLRLAADRISTALAAAELYERSRRAERLSAALVDVSALVNASLDPDQTIENGLRVVVEALDATGAILTTLEPRGLRVRYAAGVPLVGQLVSPAHMPRDVEGPVTARHVSPGTAEADWARETLGFEDATVVPVRVALGIDGALVVGRSGNANRQFDDLEQDFVTRLATMLGSALNNAGRFETEHHIAETLQESLLTLPGAVSGVRFASLYHSATVSSRVGGDFFDVFSLPGGCVAALIGDVSGKGLEAAMVTTLVKDTVRAYAHEHPSPAEVMARANTVLNAASRLPAFASAILAVIDVATGQVTYCCAGHPPALVLRPDGIEVTDSESPVIGAFDHMTFVDQHLSLGPADVLFLYTDGVTEARSATEGFFGDERLLDALEGCSAEHLDSLPKSLLERVERFAGGRLSDDIALLAIALDAETADGA